METKTLTSPTWPVAWSDSPDDVVRATKELISFDAMAVGLAHGRQVRPDEIMLAKGWPEGAFLRWLDTEASDDKTFFAAQRNGVACDEGSSGVLVGGGHLLIASQTESLSDAASWWVAFQRKSEPYLPVEQRMAELIIRCWQSHFGCASRSNDGRIVMGHDRSILHADPCTRVRFAQQPDYLTDISESFIPTVTQRWNTIEDENYRDVAMRFAGETQWIRFRRHNPLGRDDAVHWRLDLTPLEEGELPAVGLIEDERIAQALAYIHDHFHESPNLSSIAKAVHLSPFHFHRIFSKLVGISPKQYLQAKQLQTARWMLRSTSKAIGDIAEATGFASHGHFTSTFHRVVGLSPSEYREKSD